MDKKKNKEINCEKVEGVDDMDTVMERYCTVEESLEKSLKEMKLIRQGKLPKLSIKDAFKTIKEKDKYKE